MAGRLEGDALREDEIRPSHLMGEQAASFARDIERLARRQSEFVRVRCPACDGERSTLVFTKYGLNYDRCLECETVYVNPRPSPKVLRDYYEHSENYAYWSKVVFPASEAARREKIFRPRLERLLEVCRLHGLQPRTLLEVGAGFGIFCDEAVRIGAFERVIAVEPTPELAQNCRERGLEVIEQPIEEVRLPDWSVDVVASFEVLEHLFSPAEFLMHCGRLLRRGGLLVLTCPNVKGFDVLTLGSMSDVFDVEHLNYFHPDSLSRLAARHGFEVLEVLTPGKLDAELVRKKILAGQFDVSDYPFIKLVLLDAWTELGPAFQRFLAESGLSSHMWLVAQTHRDRP